MKAMIFAAGLGTRLKPLTDTTPKALIPVGGKTLLEHVIIKLKDAGFKDIVINIHHFGEQIIDFLQANNNFGINIAISDERGMLLETGGGIKKAANLLGNEPFLIHNVDILSNADLGALYRANTQSNAFATLLVNKRESSRYLLFAESRLNGWTNVKTGEIKSPYTNIDIERTDRFAFSGIQVFSPQLFKYMDNFPDKFSIIDFYLAICNKEKISYYIQEDLKLLDVGKIDSLEQAESFI